MSEEQVVVFRLAKEEYAIPIAAAKEIMQYRNPTELPNTPAYLKGIINVRGQLIPVISLAARFGLADAADDNRRVIIVESGSQEIGIIVDEVTEVHRLDAANIEPAPSLGDLNAALIRGIGKADSRLIILLNPDSLVDGGELAGLQAAAQPA